MCRFVRPRLLLFALVALAGCNTVAMKHPIGDAVSDEEGQRLDGPWALDQGVFHAKYVSGGKLVIGVLDWDDKESGFTKHEITAQLTQAGDRTFITLPRWTAYKADASATGEENWIACAQYELVNDGQELKLWAASPEEFAVAVNGGKLAGTVKKTGRNYDVRVTATAEELAAFVEAETTDKLFPRKDDAPGAKRIKLPRP